MEDNENAVLVGYIRTALEKVIYMNRNAPGGEMSLREHQAICAGITVWFEQDKSVSPTFEETVEEIAQVIREHRFAQHMRF